MRIHHVNREGTEEHLEHVFVQVEVHGALRLRVGSVEVEMRNVAFTPHFALDLVRAHTHAVVAQVILEYARLFRDEVLNDELHGVVVALQHDVHRAEEDVVAEPVGDLATALGSRLTGCDQRVQIEAVPGRGPHVVQDEFENVFLQHARRKSYGRENPSDRADLDDPVASTPVREGGGRIASLRMDLEKALARLKPVERTCVVLSYRERMSHGEISESTGLALGTVKSHILRGSTRLREYLKDYEGDVR